MFKLNFIRENIEKVIQNTGNKNESVNVEEILSLDERRREIINEADRLKNTRNIVSKEISALKREKKDASEKINAMKDVSKNIKDFDDELREIEAKLNDSMLKIPNMLHESVPVGKSESDNIEVRSWGTPKESIEKNHLDISRELGILDFERGAKVAGSGFAFYLGKGSALERALINFMIDLHIEKHGYTEIMPPFVVNAGAMTGTGQLPKMEEDMYHCEKDGLYLIPTAEVPITNFYAGEMLNNENLPINLCGFSPCFRREAGSYGKEVHGFLRVHQFNKVEMVKICRPEESYDELEKITSDAEDVLKALEIPYRTLLLCSGDTSFASAKTYDLEIWTPGEQQWLEVSSCSNFEDFQARRAKIRFKRKPNSKPEFVHTLNGSGLATSRLMVSIIENYYDNGKIRIPGVLKKYTGFDYI